MQIEDYFDIVADTAIRIRGTRVGIETVIDAYRAGAAPEEILIRYPALSLRQIYITIAYYLTNQEQLDTYVARVRADQEAGWQEQQQREQHQQKQQQQQQQHSMYCLLGVQFFMVFGSIPADCVRLLRWPSSAGCVVPCVAGCHW